MDLNTFDEVKDKLGLNQGSRPLLIGMAIVLVLVAAAAGHVLIGSATTSQMEISKSDETLAHAADEASEESQQEIIVHVSGAVNTPGVYSLEASARVIDAINEAGGLAEDANDASLNMARTLTDGEQVVVASNQPQAQSELGITEAGQPVEAVSLEQGKININTADATLLQELPGIGASTAQKIIADRNAHGPFSSVSDLTRVSGIGEKKLSAIQDLITV